MDVRELRQPIEKQILQQQGPDMVPLVSPAPAAAVSALREGDMIICLN